VTTPTVSPLPVKTAATVATSVNQPVSSLTITVTDSSGRTIKTLYSAAASGQVSKAWDRTDSAGRRVKSGTYAAVVVATSSTATARASSSFSVS
jgi:flagellar hook assembly protein FlgD